MSLTLISILRGGKNRTNSLFAGTCLTGALVNAAMVLVLIFSGLISRRLRRGASFIPDKTLGHILTGPYILSLSLPIYIQFIHSFLHISGRKWLMYTACVVGLFLSLLSLQLSL